MSQHSSGRGLPQRIVCLTEETVEALYRMGAGDRIVGVSGYAVRPPEVREKPRVSAYTNASFDRIDELRPDLVITWSDLQGDITAELMKRGHTVIGFNHRSVAGILDMIAALGRIAGCVERAGALIEELEGNLAAARARAERLPARPRVFFEEWDEPMISGITWVSELVEIAGGIETFPELRGAGLARERIVSPEEARARRPDLILVSWCGKRVDLDSIRAREGWSELPAISRGQILELDPSIILQPGPAALGDGLAAISGAIEAAAHAMISAP
jgi:iron complex transport system substrate-binding protein